jgi:uroporphyrin-III C-methyltransferase/precorrin-2 dehydrogenase/sirohydrochlorin ferrochelatase
MFAVTKPKEDSMRYFPIYIDTKDQKLVVAGAGECAVAKLRLLLKTEANIAVFGSDPQPEVLKWQQEGVLHFEPREISAEDVIGARLLYAANDDEDLDRAAANLAREYGVQTLIVDNLEDSDFITPAIVDRAPVTVAIGTEGAAPVLARKIKSDIEEMLPASLGILARVGKAFRPMVNRLPFGAARREFWARYYFDQGPVAVSEGEWALDHVLNSLLSEMENETPSKGHVSFVGAGPGDPELLTLKARKRLHKADVVIYDRLVSTEILELARREATLIEVGKTPFGPSWKQEEINALLVNHGKTSDVIRLKSGDCSIFGRLDEETEALDLAGIEYDIIPGITSALSAAAKLKVSLTRRGRNRTLRVITGYDAKGFADHDWRTLAAPGEIAAIYMGKASANFMRGRLLMHGAHPETPISVVENASRPDQRIIPTTLLHLQDALVDVEGPAVLMFGLAPHNTTFKTVKEAL